MMNVISDSLCLSVEAEFLCQDRSIFGRIIYTSQEHDVILYEGASVRRKEEKIGS
jgi:hypothetical protein